MRTALSLSLLLTCMTIAPLAQALAYTETFETAPTDSVYAALLESPNGLHYDYFPGRAHSRLAPYPITVIGTGDEVFYWGNNDILPAPAYGLPGPGYSSNETSYLINGYGTGYEDYVLGIDFTAGPTQVYSLDFGTANGSNAPTAWVTVTGFAGGVEQWQQSNALIAPLTLEIGAGAAAVDRIEISRAHTTIVPFQQFPVGWYTLDNLSYDATPDGNGTVGWGDYVWQAYTPQDVLGSLSPVPETETWGMLLGGVFAMAALRRRQAVRGGAGPLPAAG